jgi:protein-S-isoprenylcysteine O-methyltransferase Ste14
MELFIGLAWCAFYIYWLFSAFSAKKNMRVSRTGAFFRVIILLAIIFFIITSEQFRQFAGTTPHSAALAVIGAALCVAGLAFAVWARVHLGKNWGMPMSLKEQPELITSGPYRLVRHPIYSGILLAMLGSALVGGAIWLLIAVIFGCYFIYAAKKEQHIMLKEFPDQYSAYMKRSKMLIPWIF